MAIHTIDMANSPCRLGIGTRPAIGSVDHFRAGLVNQPDPRNLLQLVICRDVLDLIGQRHVHVDALHPTRGLIAAAGLEEHVDLVARVGFVRCKMDDLDQLSAEELLRPMALLARLACRAQVLDRRRNGT